MNKKKRIISILLALLMCLTIITPNMFYEANASEKDTITVYFTLSNDGKFVTGNDQNETVLCHVPVEISYYDLADYGLEDYYRYEANPFEQGGGYNGDTVIETPTVLHLYIKMLEKYYLGGKKLEVGTDALTVDGSATHLYMTNFWGHDENLMYFVDHKYPLQSAGWGSTCDYILLEDGMEIDVAMYTDWNFYHTGAFAEYSSKTPKTNGQYRIKTGEDITLFMGGTATSSSVEGDTSFVGEPMAKEDVCICKKQNAHADNSNDKWSVIDKKTDDNGNVTLRFDEPGTYYVSSTPLYRSYVMDSGNPCVAPPIAEILVEGDGTQEDYFEYNGTILDSVTFGSGITDSAAKYEMDGETIYVPDYKENLYVKANTTAGAPSRCKIKVQYGEEEIDISDTQFGTRLPNLISKGGVGTSLKIIATCENKDSQNVVEERQYSIKRIATLDSLSVEGLVDFDRDKDEYEISIMEGKDKLRIEGHAFLEDGIVKIDGETPSDAEININDKKSVVVSAHAEGCKDTSYTINITWKKYGKQSFRVTRGTILTIRDKDGDVVTTKECNLDQIEISKLVVGDEYTYTATCSGYVAKTGSFTCAEQDLPLDIALQKANINESITNVPALWPNFRGNDENNGLTAALTPTSYNNAQLYWAVKAGYNYGTGAPSSPILVDGYLIYTTATSIVKMDTVSGEIVKTGEMVRTSAFNITPPTYADGMIFVALASGTIQAFNADTLESLWVYHDNYYGQPNCPITYVDGYIYTGFWNGEDRNANFVCLNACDEDVTKGNEEKIPTWTYKHKGGFYWAGAYGCKDFIVVGSDDGNDDGNDSMVNGKGTLLVFNPKTGAVIDSSQEFDGDIRSAICYDKETKRYYFTSKGGYLYSVSISKEGKIGDIKEVSLNGASTSTPVVYNGRAYIGVRGSEMFGANSGHSITVVDLDSMSVAYKMNTRGYPQTSGLLTTGYDDGYVYVYFIDNYEPGKLRVLKDKVGQKEPIITRQSDYDEEDDVNVLFTPKGAQANYAICSPVADEYGTLYFKNDSSYMMALGSKIERIAVTKEPDKTIYEEGESFDPTGMIVTAFYANGNTRDVTKYVTFNKETVSSVDTDVEVTFPYASYNDELNNSQKFDRLFDVVDIVVQGKNANQEAEEAKKLIDSIPEVVTLNDRKVIVSARSYVNQVSYGALEKIDNYQKLVDAEKDFDKLIKDELDKGKIDASLSFQSSKAVLKWAKIKYAEGYNILQWDSNRNKFVKISTCSSPQYTVDTNKLGLSFKLKIEAFAKGLSGSTVIGSAGEYCYNFKSEKPVINNKKANSDGSITVAWDKIPGAKGYTVLASLKKSVGFKAVKTVTSNSAKVTGLKANKKYYFKVKAYATYEGKKITTLTSSSVSCLSKLPAPKFTIKATKGKISLKITKVSGAKKYYIYRSKKKSGSYKLIGTSKKISYIDRKIKKNVIYYYKLRAVGISHSKTNYSDYSATKHIVAK